MLSPGSFINWNFYTYTHNAFLDNFVKVEQVCNIYVESLVLFYFVSNCRFDFLKHAVLNFIPMKPIIELL